MEDAQSMRSKLFLSSRKDLLTMETLLRGQLKKIAAGGEVFSVTIEPVTSFGLIFIPCSRMPTMMTLLGFPWTV